MPRGEEPLLARTNSEHDSDREAEEEDALLTGHSTRRPNNNTQRWKELGLFVWALIATIVVVILAVVVDHERTEAHKRKPDDGGSNGKPAGKRNLIFMVSDGMGPASLELARSFRQYTENLPYDDILALDKHLIGQSRTRSSSSLVTDSAAGATAFACGLKSYNGAISVLPDHMPCGTILEAAKQAGYMTGLVVTTRITDATPACFGAHANLRSYEDLIAEQLIGHYPLGRMVDLIIGGGRCHFLPNSTEGSCRNDSKDVIHMAKKKGFNYIDSRKDFDDLNRKGEIRLPLLALMAGGDIPYEIDRRHIPEEYPAEVEMAQLALDALAAATKDSEKGFFIMIEGSRIDHAGHSNDPAAQVHEVIAHDKAFSAVLEFLDRSDDEGVLISTSDHETGGLSAARQLGTAYPNYLWYPAVLANATNSASWTSRQWRQYLTTDPSRAEQFAFLKKLVRKLLGFDPTVQELDQLVEEVNNPFLPATYLFANMISRRAEIGWATHGHSGVDVNIYASKSKHAQKLAGNHENIEIGKFMADYLDLDLDAVTEELIRKGTKTSPQPDEQGDWDADWMGPIAHVEDIKSELEVNAHVSTEWQTELRRRES